MENKICTVPTLSALYALQNHIEGETAYCEETSKFYSWQEDGWGEIKFEGDGVSMNLYDLNKSIINQLPPLTEQEIAARIETIETLFKTTGDNHYMLLCKEYNYYTIFAHDTHMTMPTFGAAVCEIINHIGNVYSIEMTQDEQAIEIWIKPDGEESVLAFYLFPYDAGVVYYG